MGKGGIVLFPHDKTPKGVDDAMANGCVAQYNTAKADSALFTCQYHYSKGVFCPFSLGQSVSFLICTKAG